MSLCDHCVIPGACCRSFPIGSGKRGDSLGQRETLIEVYAMIVEAGYPFVPLMQEHDGRVLFWCPNLNREGRCGDYEHRPSPCRSFIAGQEDMCCHSPDYWDGGQVPIPEYAFDEEGHIC